MKLARHFKFYSVGMPEDIYNAYYESDDEVMVTWHWSNAPFDSGAVPYDVETVEQRHGSV